MALVKTESAPRQDLVPRNSPQKRAGPEILAIFLLCLIASVFVSFNKTQEVQQHHDETVQHKEDHTHGVPVRKVGAEPLANEQLFLSTIKNCLPQTNKKCKKYIPENTSTQRIAIMAPPGDMTQGFLRFMDTVVERAETKHDIDIALIPTSHIAPYGYGKTHGWTKIIRIIPNPLLLGATNALEAVNLDQGLDGITVNDIKSSLRQQIRYHCRLSHVAAHTSMWSLDLEELVGLSPEDLESEIRSFLELEEEENPALDEEQRLSSEEIEHLFFSMSSSASAILTHAQTTTKDDILKTFDDVLLDELRISKNLTSWPCESFWTVGDPSDNPQNLSPSITKIAEAISPNCTAPFTSCFVKRDLCEAKGDSECHK